MKNIRRRATAAVSVIGVFICCAAYEVNTRDKSPGLNTEATVLKVHDGDTITILVDGDEQSCRLLGIDAPEVSYTKIIHDIDKIWKYLPDGRRLQCQEIQAILEVNSEISKKKGVAARDYLSRIILGTSVQVSTDTDCKVTPKDRFGRWLVYIKTKSGVDINRDLVDKGHALADERFYCTRLRDYILVGQASKKAKRGMWKEGE